MKVYGIWVGEYSDSYTLDGVYSKREEADAMARANGGTVQEYTLDPKLPDSVQRLIRPGQHLWHVAMDIDGNGGQASEQWTSLEADSRCWVRKSDQARFVGQCLAKTEKAAIKVINDRRTAWIAAGRRTGEVDPKNRYFVEAIL